MLGKHKTFRTIQEVIDHIKLPFELKPKQVWALEQIIPLDRAAFFTKVGTGKTVLSTVTALKWGSRKIIIAMPPILLDQWDAWLRSIGETDISIYRGAKRTADMLEHRWVLMSHAIFRDSFGTIKQAYDIATDTLIVEECFVAGTQVQGRKESKNIESIKVGEEVLTSRGFFHVKSIFKSLALSTVTLRLQNGVSITCTETHPIFTDLGWVNAKDCQGRQVLYLDALLSMRNHVFKEKNYLKVGYRKRHPDRADLLEALWHDAQSDTCAGGVQRSWKEKFKEACSRQARSGHPSKTFIYRAQRGGIKDSQSYRTSTSSARREWPGNASSRRSGKQEFQRARISVELYSPTGQQGGRLSSYALQTRFRTPRIEDRSVDRRRRAPQLIHKGSRYTKNYQAQPAWVDCTQVDKQAGAEPVWNLEVSGCPHYFANGVLVHNCHALKSPASLLFKYTNQLTSPRGKLLLLTGTPTNKPGDAYSYIKLKTPSIYRSKGHFETCHVAERDHFNNVSKWKDLESLADSLALNSVKLTQEDIFGDTLKPIYDTIVYALDGKHKKLYDKLAQEQLLLLESGGKIDATTSQRLYHALQQIVVNWSHFCGEEKRPKAFDLIDEVIEQTECMSTGASKLSIWVNYTRSNELITTYLKQKYGPKAIAAAYSGTDSAKGVKAIMDDPQCRILVAHPKSAGVGLNMQFVSNEMLFIEASTSPMDMRQTIGRIARAGQTKTPHIRLATAKGTIQHKLFRDLLFNDDLVTRVERSVTSLRAEILGKI